MAYSELQIYNLAVDAAGGTGTIETTDEASREAELCGRWFGPMRDKVLRAAHWNSAKKYARLAQRAERTEEVWVGSYPGPGYTRAFALPSDLLIPRYMTDFARFEFTVYDENTHVISTSGETPILCYTARISPQLMDTSLGHAVTMALGAAICQPLSGATQKARMLLQEANEAILQARLESANMDQQTSEHIPDFIAVRGYGTPFQSQNYVYPFGPTFSAGDIGG